MTVYAVTPTGAASSDTAAIQAALYNIGAAGGGTLVLEGNAQGSLFLTDAPLVVQENTTIQADPGVTVRRCAAGAILMNGEYGDSFSGYNGHGNITVQGGTWDCNGTVVNNPNLGFAFAHGHDIAVRDATIKDTAANHAMELNSCKRAQIENVKFQGLYVGSGNTNLLEALQIDSARTGTFGAFGAYDSTPCTDISVRDCYFGPSGTPGTQAHPRGVGSHSAWAGYEHTNIRVIDNFFDGLAGNAVAAMGWARLRAEGNTFQGVRGAGVYLENGTNQSVGQVNIVGNVFSGGAINCGAIMVAPASGYVRGVLIKDNNIQDTTATAIYLGEAKDVIVQGNMLYKVGGNGIQAYGGDNIGVWYNYIRGASRASNGTYWGVRASGAVNGLSVRGNRVRWYGSGNEVAGPVSISADCVGATNNDNEGPS